MRGVTRRIAAASPGVSSLTRTPAPLDSDEMLAERSEESERLITDRVAMNGPLRKRGNREMALSIAPGDGLRQLIFDGAEDGRPTWGVPTFENVLQVPRLELVPGGRLPSGRWPLVQPHEASLNDASAAIRWNALVALRTGDPLDMAHALEDERSQDQLRALAIAALRDVAGWSPRDERYSALGYSGKEQVQAAARRGRRLWATLAAWPWWGAPEFDPANWWLDRSIQYRFAAWRDPERWHSAVRRSATQ